MLGTYFSPTASSVILSDTGLGALNLQEAIQKLAFLTQASSLLNQDGDIVLRVGANETNVILESPVGNWVLKATDDGELYTELIPSDYNSIATYWQFKRSDGSYVGIETNSNGELIMVNPPESNGFDINKIYVISPSGYLFGIGVTDNDEFYTEAASSPFPSFKIVNQQDQVLFSTVQHNDLSLNYMPVYTQGTLPLTPTNVDNTLPWVFYDDGSSKRPVYHDGSDWRYFNTNELVIT